MSRSVAGTDETAKRSSRLRFPTLNPEAQTEATMAHPVPVHLRELALALWLQLPDELLDAALAELIDVYCFHSQDQALSSQQPLISSAVYTEGVIVERVERPSLNIDLAI